MSGGDGRCGGERIVMTWDVRAQMLDRGTHRRHRRLWLGLPCRRTDYRFPGSDRLPCLADERSRVGVLRMVVFTRARGLGSRADRTKEREHGTDLGDPSIARSSSSPYDTTSSPAARSYTSPAANSIPMSASILNGSDSDSITPALSTSNQVVPIKLESASFDAATMREPEPRSISRSTCTSCVPPRSASRLGCGGGCACGHGDYGARGRVGWSPRARHDRTWSEAA